MRTTGKRAHKEITEVIRTAPPTHLTADLTKRNSRPAIVPSAVEVENPIGSDQRPSGHEIHIFGRVQYTSLVTAVRH